MATTDPRSQRIRASRRGGQRTARARSPSFKGRPARTCVLPVPHVPDGLTIAPIRGSAGCQGTEAIMPDNGQVERPFRYIREDFFLARSFCNLDDLNAQLADWFDTVANLRVHGTTQRVIAEDFEEQPALKPLPAIPFRAVLKLERRVTHGGVVSVGGNL